jgi:hypothetical protein
MLASLPVSKVKICGPNVPVICVKALSLSIVGNINRRSDKNELICGERYSKLAPTSATI